MTTTTPRERAIERIAEVFGRHRSVRKEGQPLPTCSWNECEVVFFNRRDHHIHQAVRAVAALQEDLDFWLEEAADQARERGEEPDPVELTEIRARHLVLAEASPAETEARLAAARAGALEAAAEEARTRGDVGKEGCINVWDFLDHRAEQARQAAARLDVVDPTDPRVAPAANAYRKAMAQMGQQTSAAQAAVAIRAALAAGDKAGRP